MIMNQRSRRQFLSLMAASTGLTLTNYLSSCSQNSEISINDTSANSRANSIAQLNSLGLGGSLTMMMLPLAYLIEKSQLPEAVTEIKFSTFKNHDRLKGLLTSRQVQISGTPTELAASLYQRDIPVQLLNVMLWGSLYVLSPQQNIRTWQDLRGKTVLIPFKNSMLENVFRYLSVKAGLSPDRDVVIQSTQDFPQTVQLLLVKRGDAALFSEPIATSAQLKGEQQGTPLYRVLNLQEEWASVTGKTLKIPQGGTTALQSLVNDSPQVIQLVQTELRKSVDWISQNLDAASELGAKYLELQPNVVRQALKFTPFEFKTAAEAKVELEFWYQCLAEQNPKLFDGKLPGDRFYSS